MPNLNKIEFADWNEYELLDTGDKLKLERFGNCLTIRSEPKAWWKPKRPDLWKKVDCRYFDGDKNNNPAWKFYRNPVAPVMDYGGVKFHTKFINGSKHLGVFPEQEPHWRYISNLNLSAFSTRPKLLNLFAYTGATTLMAAKAGFSVTHVDASKPSVDWARLNQHSSGLDSAPIRWLVDDALKFVRRQIRRRERYEAIVLDPPAFGRGPKNELWKLEKMLPELLESCSLILADKPIFVLLTLYNIEASPIMAANILKEYFGERSGFDVQSGELVLAAKSGYSLPLSIWSRAEFRRFTGKLE